MKKLLLILMCVFLIAGGVLAAEVSIIPENPITSDDLTCLVDGVPQPEFMYTWENNGQEIGVDFILSSSLTMTDQTYTCLVHYPGPWGPSYVGQASVTISDVTQPANEAPVVDLPAQITVNNANEICLHLNNYVTDDSTIDALIEWSNNGQNKINVDLQYNSGDQLVCFSDTTGSNLDYSEFVTFTAEDEDGLSGSDTIEVLYDADGGQADDNHVPFIVFTFPNEDAEFLVGQTVPFQLLGGDVDGDVVSVMLFYGDGTSEDLGDFPGSVIASSSNEYNNPGIYSVKVLISDGFLSYQDEVTIHIKDSGADFNNAEISDLKVYSEDTFTNEEDIFYRGEDIYAKFSIKDSITGELLVPENNEEILQTFIFGSGVQYALERFTGFVDGKQIVDGTDGLGTFYFALNYIPLSDLSLDVEQLGIYFGVEGYGFIEDIYQDIEVRNNLPSFNLPEYLIVPVNGVKEFYLEGFDVEDNFPYGLEFDLELSDTNLDVAFADLGSNNLNVYGKSEGSTNIKVTLTDSEGAIVSDTMKLIVSGILEEPVADAGTWKEIKPGTVIQLDGSKSYDPDGEIVEWRWSINGVTIGLGEIIDTKFEQLGEYDVMLTVVDNDGLTDIDFVLIRVVKSPKDYDNDKISGDSNSWPKVNNVLFANFAPVQYKSVYSAGEDIPMYVKFRNNSPEHGQVQVKFILTDTNGIMKSMHNLQVSTGDVKIFTTDVPLPADLDTGTYVIRAIVTDNTGIGQLTDHWVITIA